MLRDGNPGAQANKDKANQRGQVIVEMRDTGYSYKDIAEMIGISEDNARQIYSRQVKRIIKDKKKINRKKYRVRKKDE